MEPNPALFSLTIDPLTKSYLNDIARWAKFLSIVGMLFLIMGMVIALLDATIMNNQMGISVMVNGQQQETVTPAMRVMTILGIILFTAISYFPLYFLFLFSRKMKRALAANHQQDLNEAFLQMKKYFRYCGIIVIFGLLLFGLVFVLTALFSAEV